MHILLIHQAFAALDEAGGTRHHELARYLVEKGHQVTIIASPVSYLTGKTRQKHVHWLDKQSPEPGITILRTYTYSALHKSFVHRIFSFLSFMVSSFLVGMRVQKIDLVWGTSPPIFQGMTAWLIARLKRVPFLFEVRDLWPAFAIAVGVLHNRWLIRASLWLERFLYQHADRVMVNSPGFIEHVLQKGARQVDLIPNGAAPEMFQTQSDGSGFRQQNHLTENDFLVLYAGAHGMSNDLGIVLQAADQLRGQENIHFILVGDGKEKSRLQTQAASLDLHNVLFLPPVPKEQMGEILAASDAGLAILKPLDLYKTTYPNKVFDYMAAGRPVILAIDGVIREVVERASAGIAIPPGDPQAMACAVSQLAGQPEQSREMGRAGQNYIKQHFNRQDLAEKLSLLLTEMRGKHG
jgi:glycosyltransferase involved in cell wall biosynthesis